MDKCIYFKDYSEKLNYSSGDHIFSAAIGGIKKLDKGFVSDEANNALSKLERKAYQNSIISISRQSHGIGKRGKRSDKANIKSAIVRLMQSKTDGEYSLGYFLKWTPIKIGQFCFDLVNHCVMNVVISPDEKDTDLLKVIKENWTGHYNIIEYGKLDSVALLGFHEDKWYLAIPSENSLETCKKLINSLVNAESMIRIRTEKKISQTLAYFPFVYDENYYRIVAKTAFNYLASICGQEFILNKDFDKIRNYILHGGDNSNYVRAADSNGMHEFIRTEIINANNHFINIVKQDNVIGAMISIFGFISFVRLSENSHLLIEDYGYICDIKNQKEMLLSDYLSQIIFKNTI